MTPGEAKRKGLGVEMKYGYGITPFGEALLAWTDRGVCFLGFCHEQGKQHIWEHFNQQWPDAVLSGNDLQANEQLAEIFTEGEQKKLKIWLRGSPFQLQVWEALLKLPVGTHCTYGQLASFSGHAGSQSSHGLGHWAKSRFPGSYPAIESSTVLAHWEGTGGASIPSKP